MQKLCDWFNRHRDGMLDSEQKKIFESHLAVCEDCRTRQFLLNNMVRLIRNEEMPDPTERPERIATCAYDQCGSWDILFLSWLRPAPAWSTLAVLLVLISFLWVIPFVRQSSTGGEYEILMTIEGNQSGQTGPTANLTDAELERWLEQGGTVK